MLVLREPTQDAYYETKKQYEAFRQVRNAELNYARQLRKVAKHIHDIVSGFAPDDRAGFDTLQRMLEQYSYILRPWAHSVARTMIAEVNRRDINAWKRHSRNMGIALRNEILNTPIGEDVAMLMDQQVDLITSLPREAAKRVHELVTGNLYSGERTAGIVKEIMRTGMVTASRAELIARTETARAAATLTEVRAFHVGSPGYIWRTARDFKVRPEIGIKHFRQLNTLKMGSHRMLEGTYHNWNEPPIIGTKGERGHPGTIYNCRCYAEPILPDLEEARSSTG